MCLTEKGFLTFILLICVLSIYCFSVEISGFFCFPSPVLARKVR